MGCSIGYGLRTLSGILEDRKPTPTAADKEAPRRLARRNVRAGRSQADVAEKPRSAPGGSRGRPNSASAPTWGRPPASPEVIRQKSGVEIHPSDLRE